MSSVLEVRDLRVSVDGVPAVRGVSFDVRAGEVTALVGESGAGKSLTARAVLGLAPHDARVSGSVRLAGEEVAGAPPAVYRRLWGRRIGYVPQDALTVLSPVHPVGGQLAAAVRSVGRVPRAEARRRAVAALERVGIADAGRRARAYPHEFSGGMRQRAVIAMALVNSPDLVVADEPTTALDPRVQAQVLRVLAEAREAVGAGLLLITHDLAVARSHADRAVVMYAGRVCEAGPADEVFGSPRAPYTAGLVASLPGAGFGGGPLPVIGGSPPLASALPAGCAFAPRCPAVGEACGSVEPELGFLPHPAPSRKSSDAGRADEPARTVACHRVDALPAAVTDLFTREARV
ncbi:ABC transporter ATP-binding protein [Streptomyces apocyni]|uniref:ABC transporter ATP-binding protein n=1 Tax=Streptomyces apocyni TaxID=2654677 RepID=UPI0012EA6A41|nr:ABC transporter ATP-binding protein [Streptomyces apocyni]